MAVIYEYPDYFARFYDVLYQEIRTSDIEFFMDKIRGTKGKILEIGVGTGRFFVDALKGGADIYGIDVSANMIDVLKKKLDTSQHHRISVGNACHMNLTKKFDLIIAPFRVFSHIIEVDNQLLFLNNVFNHLTESGLFLFDLFVPNPKLLHEGMKNTVDFDGEYEKGKKLRRISSSVPDIVNQLLHITMRFEWEEKNEVKNKEWKFKMRFYFRYELEHLIQLSKLQLISIYGDYEGGKLDKDSKEFVIICGK